MTTINSGESTIITVPAGKALFIVGAHGTSGSVRRLNEALGGNAASRIWDVSEGALEQIDPLNSVQSYQVVCTVGSIDATVGDAVLGAAKLSSDSVSGIPASGGVAQGSPVAQAAPIISTRAWAGTSSPRLEDFGYESDLIIVKAPGQYAAIYTREQWYGNIQSFGHTALSGADAVPGPAIHPSGLGLVAGQAAVNASGSTYYAVGISDNGSGILKSFAYNGFRDKTVGAPDNQGATSNTVSMDLIAGSNPAIVHIKRDAVGAGHEGVWATPSWAKKESAAAVDNTLLTLATDGTIALSTSIAVNENDGGIVGEAHNCFSLHSPGKYWELLTYVGTGIAQQIAANGLVACAINIPQAAAAMQFWIEGMGVQSADGGQTALHSDRLYGGNGYVAIGSDASVNTLGVTYVLVVFYKSLAPEKPRPRVRRPGGVRLTTIGSSKISCGTDASLGIAGAHSGEWIGQISDASTEQFIMGRIGNGSTGSRGTPVAGSCNYGIAYTRDPDAGIEICTSDQFSSEASTASKQRRWRTGVLLRPFTDYHLMWTHDGVDKWVLYINGAAVKWRRLPMSVFGINGITNTAGLSMGFGGRQASGTWAAADRTTHRFGRIYNRALTAAEASQMFARNALGVVLNDISDSASALVEEWKFNEATGTTVAATKSSANNGTITTGIWVP